MTKHMEDYCIDVNTSILNKHQDQLDNLEYQFTDTYTAVVDLFKDQLQETKCQEDIHDDLTFEIQVYMDRYSYSVDIEDIATQIYKDFKIKGAE